MWTRAGRTWTGTFIYLVIYFFAQDTRFPRAVNIKKEMKHVWKGHGADSEIGNVSARQAVLNRWTATDKRWKRKAVSRGSVVTSVERFIYLFICLLPGYISLNTEWSGTERGRRLSGKERSRSLGQLHSLQFCTTLFFSSLCSCRECILLLPSALIGLGLGLWLALFSFCGFCF